MNKMRPVEGWMVKGVFIGLVSHKDMESHGNDYLNGGHQIHLVERPAHYDLPLL